MKLSPRVSSGLALLAFVVVTTGCNDPPTVREVAVAGDTDSPLGPYEVRAAVFSDDGLGDCALVVDDGARTPLEVVPEATASRDQRLRGTIDGRPIGTVVRFAVEACDPSGACAQDPKGFPDDAYEFVVGDVPAVPVVDSVDPDEGPESGGSVVEIRGDGFRSGARVFFDDIEAPHVERLRADLLRVVTPVHPTGPARVEVANVDRSFADLAAGFTFTPAPTLVEVTPPSGPEEGGTRIALSGSGFSANDRVFVDGVPCRHPLLLAPTLFSCDTPPGTGLVDVVIEAEDGGRGVMVDAFRYIPAPRIDAVTPDSGNAENEQRITIIGTGFQAGAVVFIGADACTNVGVGAPDDDGVTLIECTVPPGAPGIVDVTVVNFDGQDGVLPGGYARKGPPVVVAVVPDEGPITGGLEVHIFGAGLDESDAVSFGDAVVTEVVDAFDDIELVVILPPSPLALDPFIPPDGFVAVDVTVQRTLPDDDRSAVLDDGFRYLWPPEVFSVAPESGPTAGGTRVIVTGRFFTESTTLFFDGALCADAVVVSSTQIACTTPPGDIGFADVGAFVGAVEDGFGSVAEEAYEYIPRPRVDSIEPPEGPTFGGDVVTVHGDFFRPGAVVLIDGAVCAGAVVVDAQNITCTTPPGEKGRADVTVINADGQEDTGEAIYEYVGVAVTPDHGLPVGFTRVSVRAAGFNPAVRIFFDDVVAACSFVSSREVICQTPARRANPGGNLTGLVEVRFENPDGTGDADDAFTYTELVRRERAIDNDGRNANHVAFGDADNDGDVDVFVAHGRVAETEASSVFLNEGGFVFDERALPGGDVTGNKIDLGSINNDAFPDLVIAASNAVGAVLLRSTGPAQWATVDLPLTAENSAFDAQLDDVIGDTRDDLLVLAIGCDPVLDFENNPGCNPDTFGVDVLFEQTGQNGGSTLSRRNNVVPHDPGQTHDHKFVVVDLDGDADNDVVVVVNNDPFETAQNRILRNRDDENLGFVKETNNGLADLVGDLYDIDAGDIDGDGDPDVVTSLCFGDGGVSSEVVLRNVGGDLEVDSDALPAFRGDCDIGVKLVDIDDDGDLDVMWSGADRPQNNPRFLLRLYVNRGDGTFVDASAFVPEPNLRMQGNNLACDDLDGDGDADCVIAAGAPYVDTEARGAVFVLEQRAR